MHHGFHKKKISTVIIILHPKIIYIYIYIFIIFLKVLVLLITYFAVYKDVFSQHVKKVNTVIY